MDKHYLATYTLPHQNPRLEMPHPIIEYKWYDHVRFSIQLSLLLMGMVLISAMPILGYVLALRMIYD